MIQHQSFVLPSSNVSQRLDVSSVVHVYLIVSGEALHCVGTIIPYPDSLLHL